LTQSQIEHRNTFKELDVEGIGKVKLFNMTAKFSKTPGLVETPPPVLSQHTEEILESIGLSQNDIINLKNEGVI
jgi:crotonobetainyl-CoA:carnitine CoA-transferase CaiB-like acyl-CoA transferase